MTNTSTNLRNTVFMVMPFSDRLAEDAYRCSTKPIVESRGMKCVRADEIFSANPVFDDIVAAIEQAALVVVDISGQNPNCLYELGIAHTMKQSRTIMITHDAFKNAPFDIAHFRIIQYQDTITGKEAYEEALKKTISAILSGLPEIYADEFEFLLTTLKGAGKEHQIWVVQAIALATRPLIPREDTNVEGTCPGPAKGHPGATNDGPLIDFIRPFHDAGYVVVVGNKLTLSDKGRSFADYVSAKGYVVFALNGMIFAENYVPFDVRFKKLRVAPE